MKVQKIVSLTPATAAIAENIDNFSKFVRVALIAWDAGNDFESVQAANRHKMRVLRRLEHLLKDRLGAEATWEIIQQAESFAKEQAELEVE